MIEVTRLPKNRGGFERFPNEAARNPDLSLAALGLLARLLIDGNKFSSIAAVAEHYGSGGKRGSGRDAYLEAARELAAVGYLVRTQARAAGGRMTTTIAIYAEPANAQVGPETAQPLSVPSAETPIPARHTDDGSSVVGSNREDDANVQVTPETAQAVSVPSVETVIYAGRTDNGSAGPLPYADLFQTYTDLSPKQAGQPSDHSPLPSEGGGGSIDQESEADNTDLGALADKVADAYEEALTGPRVASVRRNIRAQALALLAGGDDPESLVHAARAMPGRGWVDVGRAVAWFAVQAPAAGGTGSRRATGDPCGKCGPNRWRDGESGGTMPCPVCNAERFTQWAIDHGDGRGERQRAEDDWYHRRWEWQQAKNRGQYMPEPINAPDHMYAGDL